MAGLHAEGKPPFSHCLSDRSLQSIYDGTSMLTTSSWIKRAVPWLKEALSVWYIQWSKQVLILWKQHFLHLQPNDQQTFSKTCKTNHKFYGALFYFVFWSILLTKQHITSQLSNIPNSSFACSFWTTSPPPCSPVIHQRTCQGPRSPAPCWTWHAPSGASSAHPDELWRCSPVATLRPVKTTGPSSGPS